MRYSDSKIFLGLIGSLIALTGIFIVNLWYFAEQNSYTEFFVKCTEIVQRLSLIDAEINALREIKTAEAELDTFTLNRFYNRHRRHIIQSCNELRRLYDGKEIRNFNLDEFGNDIFKLFSIYEKDEDIYIDEKSTLSIGGIKLYYYDKIGTKILENISAEKNRQEQLVIEAGKSLEEDRLVAYFFYSLLVLIGLGSILTVYIKIKQTLKDFNFSDESLNFKLKDSELDLLHLKSVNLIDTISFLDEDTIEESIKSLVVLLPRLLRFPADACADIFLFGTHTYSPNFTEPEWKLNSPVEISGKRVGYVQVGYKQMQPETDLGQFTSEEKEYLDDISAKLGLALGAAEKFKSFRNDNAIYSALIESAPVGIMILNSEYKISVINPFAENFLSKNSEKILNLPIDEVINNSVNKELAIKIISGEDLTNELFQLDTGYGIRSALLFMKRMGHSNSVKQYIITLTEITSASENIQKEISVEKYSFRKFLSILQGLLDELADNLTTISGSSSVLLRSAKLGNETLNKVKDICEQANQCSDILRGVLVVLENIESTPEKINIAETVLNYIPVLEKLCHEKLELKIEIENDLWLVEFDPNTFQVSLAGIAIFLSQHVSKKFSLTISFKNLKITDYSDILKNVVPKGEYVSIELTSNDEEILNRILSPGKADLKKNISREQEFVFKFMQVAVSQMRGYTFMNSDIGDKPFLNIFLPKYSESTSEILTSGVIPRFDRIGVLIAGLEKSLEQQLVRLFTQKGAKVFIAERGSEALFVLNSRREKMGIIIANAVMPAMNGFQLIKSSRNINPSSNNFIIVDYDISMHNNIGDTGYSLISSGLTAEDIFDKICKIVSSKSLFIR